MRIKLFRFVIFLLIISCSDKSLFFDERTPSNIFDPNNPNKKINIGYSAATADSAIILSWNRPASLDYKGFFIYRKGPGQNSYIKYEELPKTSNFFKDSNILFDERYFYFLTIKGETLESYPTDTVSIIAGPGNIWYIDRFNWEIGQLSYDMSSTRLRRFTAWTPENFSIASQIRKGLVTNPRIRYLEIIDLDNGDVTAANSNIERPFDAVYDSGHNSFWLTDSSGNLFKINPQNASEQLIMSDLGNPEQIELFNQELFVLDRKNKSIYIINSVNPSIIDTLNIFSGQQLQNPDLFRIVYSQNEIFILDKRIDNDIIFKHSFSTNISEIVAQEKNITTFNINPLDFSIWIAAGENESGQIMQLSSGSSRQILLEGLGRITDIKFNPYNNNIVFPDIYYGIIYHKRINLTDIGSYVTDGSPSKVYIE